MTLAEMEIFVENNNIMNGEFMALVCDESQIIGEEGENILDPSCRLDHILPQDVVSWMDCLCPSTNINTTVHFKDRCSNSFVSPLLSDLSRLYALPKWEVLFVECKSLAFCTAVQDDAICARISDSEGIAVYLNQTCLKDQRDLGE